MTPDASVSFYIARRSCVSAHRRSISTARQIYRVMDGRGKLQIVLSLKDRLRLTFPAPTCTAGSAARGPDPILEPSRYLRTVPEADGHIFRGFPQFFVDRSLHCTQSVSRQVRVCWELDRTEEFPF